MTAENDRLIRIRLEEILDDVETIDGQLADPLSLGPSIRNLEETIEVYERLNLDNPDTQEDNR